MVTTKSLVRVVDAVFEKASSDGSWDGWATQKYYEFKESVCPNNMASGVPEDALNLMGKIETILKRYPTAGDMADEDIVAVCEIWDELKEHEFLAGE
ncbi:hypothetical protein ACFL02_01810 [Planctomycetota bacterium]